MRSGQCESCLEPERHLQPEWLLKMSLEFNGGKICPSCSVAVCLSAFMTIQSNVCCNTFPKLKTVGFCGRRADQFPPHASSDLWQTLKGSPSSFLSDLVCWSSTLKRKHNRRCIVCNHLFNAFKILTAVDARAHTHTHFYNTVWSVGLRCFFLFSIFDHSCGACCSVFFSAILKSSCLWLKQIPQRLFAVACFIAWSIKKKQNNNNQSPKNLLKWFY